MVKQSSKKSNPFIKTRYFIKSSGSVCCIITSGDKQYTTCLHSNGSTSCDCPAHEYGRMCKHIKLVVASEQARYAKKLQSFAARYVAFLEACHTADAIAARVDSQYGSDGRGNSKEAWKARLKAEKQRGKENAERYTAKLHLVKSEVA